VQAGAKGGSPAPIAFGDFRWQLNPTTKAKPWPNRGNSCVPVGNARSNKRGPACAAGPRSCFRRMVLGPCVPSLNGTPLGPPAAVRARSVGRVARTGLPQFSRVPNVRQDTTGKTWENLVWMAAEWWGLLPPDQLPASVRVAQWLYEELRLKASVELRIRMLRPRSQAERSWRQSPIA
jgi:hypothetical protein